MNKYIIFLVISLVVACVVVGVMYYLQNRTQAFYTYPLTTALEPHALTYTFADPQAYERELQPQGVINFETNILSNSSSTQNMVSVIHEIPKAPFEKYNEVAFADEKKGVIVGTSRRARVTNDGGNTWIQYRFAESADDFYDVTSAQGGFVAVGSSPHIFRYTEENRWELFDIRNIILDQEQIKYAYRYSVGKEKIPPRPIYPTLVSVDFYDEQNGVVVGYYFDDETRTQESIILVTKDGGVTWSAGEQPPEEMYQTFPSDETIREDFRDVVMKDQDTFVTSTNLGNVYQHKRDEGWSLLSDNQFSTGYINSVVFADDQIGFKTVYTEGFDPELVLLRTDDGGKNWVTIDMTSVGNPLGNVNEIKIYQNKAYFVVTQDDDSPSFAYVYDIETEEVRTLFTDPDAVTNEFGEGSFGLDVLYDGTVFVMNTQKLYKVMGQ